MMLAGVDVRDLAEQYGTPLMVIDEADFRSRCQDFADAFGGAKGVHYAGKAFLCSEIVRWLHDEGSRLDVCTAGELGSRCAPDSRPSGSRCTGRTSPSAS